MHCDIFLCMYGILCKQLLFWLYSHLLKWSVPRCICCPQRSPAGSQTQEYLCNIRCDWEPDPESDRRNPQRTPPSRRPADGYQTRTCVTDYIYIILMHCKHAFWNIQTFTNQDALTEAEWVQIVSLVFFAVCQCVQKVTYYFIIFLPHWHFFSSHFKQKLA